MVGGKSGQPACHGLDHRQAKGCESMVERRELVVVRSIGWTHFGFSKPGSPRAQGKGSSAMGAAMGGALPEGSEAWSVRCTLPGSMHPAAFIPHPSTTLTHNPATTSPAASPSYSAGWTKAPPVSAM